MAVFTSPSCPIIVSVAKSRNLGVTLALSHLIALLPISNPMPGPAHSVFEISLRTSSALHPHGPLLVQALTSLCTIASDLSMTVFF